MNPQTKENLPPKYKEESIKHHDNNPPLDSPFDNGEKCTETSLLLHNELKKEKKTFKFPLFSPKPPKNFAPFDEL